MRRLLSLSFPFSLSLPLSLLLLPTALHAQDGSGEAPTEACTVTIEREGDVSQVCVADGWGMPCDGTSCEETPTGYDAFGGNRDELAFSLRWVLEATLCPSTYGDPPPPA